MPQDNEDGIMRVNLHPSEWFKKEKGPDLNQIKMLLWDLKRTVHKIMPKRT